MTAFLALIQTILSGIPIIGNFLSGGLGSIIAKFFDSKTAIETARLGGAAQVAVAAQQARVAGLGVIAGSTLLSFLTILFALPLAAFLWKVVLFDVVIGAFYGCIGHHAGCELFTTDPIHGQAADWANAVIYCVFGSMTGLAIASRVFTGGK